MNIFNHKKYEGLTVHDDILGELKITEVESDDTDHPVLLEDRDGVEYWFSQDGIRIKNVMPTLRWQPNKEEFNYGEPPWIADWSDEDQRKYFVVYVHEAKEWSFDYVYTIQNPDTNYVSEYDVKEMVKYNNKYKVGANE